MIQSINIRFAQLTDLPVLVAIYNQAIRSKNATGDTQEFTIEDRKKWFESFNEKTHPLYIVETEGNVVGYCAISPYRKGRQAMKTTAEISYYIDYQFHGKSIGTKMLQHAIQDCKRISIRNLIAILLETNKPSIALLEKLNFQKWGHFPEIVEIQGEKIDHVVYGLKVF